MRNPPKYNYTKKHAQLLWYSVLWDMVHLGDTTLRRSSIVTEHWVISEY